MTTPGGGGGAGGQDPYQQGYPGGGVDEPGHAEGSGDGRYADYDTGGQDDGQYYDALPDGRPADARYSDGQYSEDGRYSEDRPYLNDAGYDEALPGDDHAWSQPDDADRTNRLPRPAPGDPYDRRRPADPRDVGLHGLLGGEPAAPRAPWAPSQVPRADAGPVPPPAFDPGPAPARGSDRGVRRPARAPSGAPQAAAAFGRKVGLSVGAGLEQGVGWVRGRAASGMTALRSRSAKTPDATSPRPSAGHAEPWRAAALALSLFSVLPVPPSWSGRDAVADGLAGRALRWLPAVGALLSLLGWAVALIFWGGAGHGTAVLGAMVWVCAMALLTRGLHLDGLADVADGLGSRRPAAEALVIMRKSDIGPFGVAAVVTGLLLQFGAVLTVFGWAGRGQALVLLLVAAVTGRLAALDAARPTVPAVRPAGFGALVAGTAPVAVRAGATGVTLVLGWLLLGLTSTGFARALWLPLAVVVGLVAGRLVTAHTVRRLGGVNGDVFGAVVEITTTVALLVLAAVIGWNGLGAR